MANEIQPRMLRIEEAATYLGATVWFVRSLCWAHKIKFAKHGKRIVIDREELDRFIEQEKREVGV